MWAAGINIIIGLWLMFAPAALQYGREGEVSTYIVAPLLITFAITAMWEVNRSARYVNVLAGVWLALSPFVLSSQSAAEVWNSAACGIMVAALSLVKGKINGRYGGGWKSLFQKDPLHHRHAESR